MGGLSTLPGGAQDAAKSAQLTGGDRPELTEASAVVSVDRGVGSAASFDVVKKLADSLGPWWARRVPRWTRVTTRTSCRSDR